MCTLLVGDSHVRRFENYVKGLLRYETFNISDLEDLSPIMRTLGLRTFGELGRKRSGLVRGY